MVCYIGVLHYYQCMVQNDSVKVEKRVAHVITEGSDDELDIKQVIACMKEVGYRDSEGYLVLPDYYDD